MAAYSDSLKQLDLPLIDAQILDFWQKNDIFKKSVEQKDPKNAFVFYEGPPSANGKPGIHHVMGRTVKDIFCRFHTMQGRRVERKGGWDTHGLPIELSVEKELGITKEDIGNKITVDEYNAKCKETVMQYKDVWDDITRKMGYWVDLDHPYITFKNEYIESVWWLLSQLYKKGLLYKGYTIQPYSPAAGTGLSSHELNQPGTYRDVSDTTVIAQFLTIHESLPQFLEHYGDIHILAWTTTPWTLPSNTALTVGPDIEYVLVKTYNQYTFRPIQVILAKELVSKVFTNPFRLAENQEEFLSYQKDQKFIPYLVDASFSGESIIGVRYEPLLPYATPYENPQNAFRVIGGNFVTTEDGTGIVHTAPTFGADDAKVAKEAHPEIPPMLVKDQHGNLVPLVTLQGKFRDELDEIGGKYVKNEYYPEGQAPEKSVDVEISIKLKIENKAFKVEKYVHNYPHCWRTDKPVLYYPLDSWFIRSTAMKDKMIELNKTINWKPAHTGEKRFGNWLENLNDWNLSRSRYWGIPLPIWRTENASEEICIDSMAQLNSEIEKANETLGLQQVMPDDLHRPYIDEIILVSKNGKPMKRETDLIDVWFDSGSMPYAQWHYPMEHQSYIDQGLKFPADFIAEGVDQTRGWFFTLHAIASMVFESVAYKTVVSNGLVLDKNGVKMSKRLGNVIDPFETIATYGADATRWYMISNAQPWDNLKFDLEGIDEIRRKFFGTLFNTYNFFILYANIDAFQYKEDYIHVSERPEIDRWIISKLNHLIQDVQDDFSDYEPTNATRKIMEFVDEHLSNWYVRLCRRRFWKGEYGLDKIAAYQTLYDCLLNISKLSAPVAPMFSEWLYNNLNSATGREVHESVHLADFPVANLKETDDALEQRMDYAQRISSVVHSIRKKVGHRVRQPLAKIILPIIHPSFIDQVEAVKELILSEVNIKKIEYITDTEGFIKKKSKANFKTLGKSLGKNMKDGAAMIAEFDQAKINELEKKGVISLTINGEAYSITPEDVEISFDNIPGWQVGIDKDITVALDISLDDALIHEGLAKELVNRIQNMRKNADLNVTDKISVVLEKHDVLEETIRQFGDYIKQEVLAETITFAGQVNDEKVEISDEIQIAIGIAKI
ncbi:MAG: isoleucine--tRNA ligase [Lewinellaceae bacterium]|nr:isoleucine--tRNA ligase [Lewinellaceae bacterium]